MTRTGLAVAGLSSLLLAACAQPDRVVFVTGTQIDLGYDLKLGTVNIGYDRNELVVGPADPVTGTLPPVYAYIASDLGIFQHSVKQLYATGDAAVSLSKAPPSALNCGSNVQLGASNKVMFFGTATHFGFKAHFVDEAPDSISLGFKRKEFSVLPVDRNAKIGSVIAGLDLSNVVGIAQGKFGVKQVIATGAAAECFAQDPVIGRNFKDAAQQAAGAAATP